MEIGHSANAQAMTGEQAVQGLCKSSTISRRAAGGGGTCRLDQLIILDHPARSSRHACRQIGARPAGHLRLHPSRYCSIEQFFRIFDSLPQGFGLFFQRHPAHTGVLQIADTVVAKRSKRSIIKRTSAADMLDKLGCKILKRECDHARLSSAAVRILEDLFIIHRVSSPVCARGRKARGLLAVPSVSVFRRRFYRPPHVDRGVSKSRSDRRKMGPGAGPPPCVSRYRAVTRWSSTPYACTGDSRGCNC